MTEKQVFINSREIKTPQGIRLGDAEYRGGLLCFVVKRGKRTEAMLARDLIERIYGKKVERIVFKE